MSTDQCSSADGLSKLLSTTARAPAWIAVLVFVIASEVPALNRPALGALPLYDHVLIVFEENHSYTLITSTYAASAPYINQTLIAEGASLTRAYGEEHASEGNYLWFLAGSDFGIAFNDPCPLGPYSAPNLAASLITAGYTFKGYSEDLPSIGSTVCTYNSTYARKHSPWVNFSNIPNGTTVATSSNLRFVDFPSDYTTLPTVSCVIPNLLDDMHDGSDPARITAADTWLQTHIDAYYQWAKTHNSLLILTWDEANGGAAGLTTPPDNQIVTVFAGAHIVHGLYAEGNGVNHVNMLRTLEDMYGLPHAGAQDSQALGAGLNNNAITDVFAPTGPLIWLSTRSLAPAAFFGNSPPVDTFTVANSGTGTLSYSITDDAANPDWLSVSPSGGTSTGPTDTTAVTVTYSTASLRARQYHATITVSAAGAGNTPQTISVNLTINTVKGDFDGDGDVDQEDYGHLQACLTGSGVSQTDPNCQDARLTGDAYVDQSDVNLFLRCTSGAGILANPNCAN